MSFDTWAAAAGVISALLAVSAIYAGAVASRKQQREHEVFRRIGHLREVGMQRPTRKNTPPSKPSADRNDLSELAERLEVLEAKIPGGEGALDIYTSVNDAILATRLESLGRRIDRLESEAMTPGRVITHVFAVLAVLAAILAAVLGILQQFAG